MSAMETLPIPVDQHRGGQMMHADGADAFEPANVTLKPARTASAGHTTDAEQAAQSA